MLPPCKEYGEHTWCPHTFEPPSPSPPPPLGFISHFSSIHNPPGDASPWPLQRSELSSCWQVHRYYIYNKHFANKLTALSLYQESFINNNIVNQLKCIYWFNYKIVIGSGHVHKYEAVLWTLERFSKTTFCDKMFNFSPRELKFSGKMYFSYTERPASTKIEKVL